MFNYPRLSVDDPRLIDAVNAANNEWAAEILERVDYGSCVAIEADYGVAVLSVNRDTVIIVSYHGSNLHRQLELFKEQLLDYPQIKFVELHTDNPAILRLWKKGGIVPAEYIARIKVNG